MRRRLFALVVGFGWAWGALQGASSAWAQAPEVRGVPPAPPLVLPHAIPARVARGPEAAQSVAARLQLSYQDDGTSVLLSDVTCRVRVYANTHVLSLDGQDQHLRGFMVRSAQGVTIPGPAVEIIEGHVGRARSQAATTAALTPGPAARAPGALGPVPRLPAAPGGSAKPLAAPPGRAAPAAKPASVAPDPAWVVAPTSRAWRWVVLHHSDDVSGCLSKYHRVHLVENGWEHGCGYHFVIGNGSETGDGAVEVSGRWRQQLQGAHAKTDDNLFNEHGVGICLVGNFDVGAARPTAQQMRSLVRLVQWLIDRYDIPVSHVVGHSHCKPTACPGKNFPWAELRAQLRGPARSGAPQVRAAPPPLSFRPATPVAPVGTVPLLGAGPTATPALPRAPAGPAIAPRTGVIDRQPELLPPSRAPRVP